MTVKVPDGTEYLDDEFIVRCQWGWCVEVEPHPAPGGWGVYDDSWFCPVHLREAKLEDGVGWTIAVPDARHEDGYRRKMVMR